MTFYGEIIVSILLVISGIFGLVGSWGMVKLSDTMRRLHAPTKATTVGVGGVVVASMAYAVTFRGTLTVHELMITLFLFLTAPITANFIAKCYMHLNLRPQDLPPTSTTYGWAAYDDPPADDSGDDSVLPG